jgi:glycosyltransferase involved in cell wall biosynthesis
MPAEVLHVLGTAEPAAASIAGMVRMLATQLDPEAYRLSACFLGRPGPWTAALNDSGVATSAVAWPSPLQLWGAHRFWKFLRSRRPDLLHIHYGGRSVRRLARAATGAPQVMHLHGRVRNESDFRPMTLQLIDVDAVIATSYAVADMVKADHVRVVYPGVSLTGSIVARDPWTIGAAGRLVPIKGYDLLIEAFAEVRAKHPGARLEIAGEGPSRADLERRVAILGLGHAVTFLGWCENLPALMARWSLFVQPSMEEALGITVLQAMASGLPVVASDVGGLPEIVKNGVTGLLVPPADVSMLAEGLADLLTQPDRCQQLGEAARESAEHFSEARFAAGVSEVYRELLRPCSAANSS